MVMKKIFSVLMALLLIAAFSTAVMADPFERKPHSWTDTNRFRGNVEFYDDVLFKTGADIDFETGASIEFADGVYFNDEIVIEPYTSTNTVSSGQYLAWAIGNGNVLFLSGASMSIVTLPEITEAMDGYPLFVKNISGNTTRYIQVTGNSTTRTSGHTDVIELTMGSTTSGLTDYTIDRAGEWRMWVADYVSGACSVWRLMDNGSGDVNYAANSKVDFESGASVNLENGSAMFMNSGTSVTFLSGGTSLYQAGSFLRMSGQLAMQSGGSIIWQSGASDIRQKGAWTTFESGTSTIFDPGAGVTFASTPQFVASTRYNIARPSITSGTGFVINAEAGDYFVIDASAVAELPSLAYGPGDQNGVTIVLPTPTVQTDGWVVTIVKGDSGGSVLFLYSGGLPIGTASATTDAPSGTTQIDGQGESIKVLCDYNSAVSWWILDRNPL